MQTINEFIAKHGLSMTAKPTDRNLSMSDDDWSHNASHWRCTIKGKWGRMTVTFSMGSGHHGRTPELAEVLDSLASDACLYENASDFADFVADLGLNEDSRSAERTYRQCGQIAARLRRVLGNDNERFEELLYETERY